MSSKEQEFLHEGGGVMVWNQLRGARKILTFCPEVLKCRKIWHQKADDTSDVGWNRSSAEQFG
jgi:hypothetical protein